MKITIESTTDFHDYKVKSELTHDSDELTGDELLEMFVGVAVAYGYSYSVIKKAIEEWGEE